MGVTTVLHDRQRRVGRLAARALLKLIDGLRAADVRMIDLGNGDVERLTMVDYCPPIDWPIDIGEPCLDLSEEELLVLAELAEEQDDPFIPPPRLCRALRRTRARRVRHFVATH